MLFFTAVLVRAALRPPHSSLKAEDCQTSFHQSQNSHSFLSPVSILFFPCIRTLFPVLDPFSLFQTHFSSRRPLLPEPDPFSLSQTPFPCIRSLFLFTDLFSCLRSLYRISEPFSLSQMPLPRPRSLFPVSDPFSLSQIPFPFLRSPFPCLRSPFPFANPHFPVSNPFSLFLPSVPSLRSLFLVPDPFALSQTTFSCLSHLCPVPEIEINDI